MSAETESRGKTASPTSDVGPVAAIEVFTLGYQTRDLEEVLRTVQSHRIEQVLDVREYAMSKKPGFSAAELKEALARIGVAYIHLPELGCSRGSRHALWRGKGTEAFLEEYRRRLAERPQAYAELIYRIRSARSLLLCLERDPSRCHRAVLGERVRAEGIPTQDL
jgi:uncharacterized protein (DUF488 family)